MLLLFSHHNPQHYFILIYDRIFFFFSWFIIVPGTLCAHYFDLCCLFNSINTLMPSWACGAVGQCTKPCFPKLTSCLLTEWFVCSPRGIVETNTLKTVHRPLPRFSHKSIHKTSAFCSPLFHPGHSLLYRWVPESPSRPAENLPARVQQGLQRQAGGGAGLRRIR